MENSLETPKKTDLMVALEKVKPDIAMQFELALRFYGLHKEIVTLEEANPYIMKWVEHNKQEFSAHFRTVLAEQPDLLGLYKTNPEEALERMESALYQKEEVHN
jgi:hypothetical protein